MYRRPIRKMNLRLDRALLGVAVAPGETGILASEMAHTSKEPAAKAILNQLLASDNRAHPGIINANDSTAGSESKTPVLPESKGEDRHSPGTGSRQPHQA